MPISTVLDSGSHPLIKNPIKIWTDDIDEKAVEQLVNLSALPFVFKHIAVMPDVHVGMGSTIGSVVATRGAITPATVGVQCSWCDCDIALDETEHRCGGCPNAAAVIMHQFRHGSAVRVDVPLCTGCHPDAARFVLALAMAGGTR